MASDASGRCGGVRFGAPCAPLLLLLFQRPMGGPGLQAPKRRGCNGLTPATPHCAPNVSVGSAVVAWCK